MIKCLIILIYCLIILVQCLLILIQYLIIWICHQYFCIFYISILNFSSVPEGGGFPWCPLYRPVVYYSEVIIANSAAAPSGTAWRSQDLTLGTSVIGVGGFMVSQPKSGQYSRLCVVCKNGSVCGRVGGWLPNRAILCCTLW